jgi:hypothetical protein
MIDSFHSTPEKMGEKWFFVDYWQVAAAAGKEKFIDPFNRLFPTIQHQLPTHSDEKLSER